MMLEAEPAYISDNPTAMTRRTLLTALLAVIIPKPIPDIGPPMPITCIGMKPSVAEMLEERLIFEQFAQNRTEIHG
jgi:hypothetical protein